MTGLFTNAQNCDFLCNGDFENPSFSSSPNFIDSTQLSCWKTTASNNLMEIWQSSFMGVNSYSGNQFMEVNAYGFATVYQEFLAYPGMHLEISFAHRGRVGIDSMQVSIGESGGPYTILGNFGDNELAWNHYTLYYVIPINSSSNKFQLRFAATYVASNNPSVGNFLDDVNVCRTEVGMNQLDREINQFYYNPTSHTLFIDMNNYEKVMLRITNTIGEQIMEMPVSSSKSTIELFSLKQGVFIATLYDKGFSQKMKFVIAD
ncbi:MAG: T9SS type A sorting domain-containing protein [Bacteroidetes bacterium]|nr:T9SS type A sorting domain-containing protein [Bacteroidota bacterium]